jgi:hypothetical protein
MQSAADGGTLEQKVDGIWQPVGISTTWKIRRICELGIPLEALNPEPGEKIFCYLTLTRNNEETGRWPTDAPMLLTYAGPEIELENWLI